MKCDKCNQYMPPGYTKENKEKTHNVCLFCDSDSDMIVRFNPLTDLMEKEFKHIVVNRYREFLESIKNSSEKYKTIKDNFI